MAIFKLGIDDAGRGPVIGPMILAGCLLDENTEDQLKKLGVKDSKQLTQKRREHLAKIIREKAISYKIFKVIPEKIDLYKSKGLKLNELEAEMAARIINEINDKDVKITVALDCPSTTRSKWRDYLITKLKNMQNLEVYCDHKAESKYVSVAAASILAKCAREREMHKIREKYGTEAGSGYTSDPLTQKFLLKYAEKYEAHGIFRKSWETYKTAIGTIGQRTLNL